MAAMVLSTLGMQAEDKVTAKVSGSNLNIGLENETSFCAFQMDIQLPAGVTASKVDKTGRLKQGANVTIDGESVETPFVIADNVLEGNILRIVAYNMGNNSIENATGDILTVALNGTIANASDITIDNIKFVKVSDLAEIDLSKTIGEDGRKIGDVDGKDGVTIDDVVMALNIYLKKEPDNGYADIDGKDGVTIDDVVAILNIYLKK